MSEILASFAFQLGVGDGFLTWSVLRRKLQRVNTDGDAFATGRNEYSYSTVLDVIVSSAPSIMCIHQSSGSKESS
jgi:GH24 family phage-related lysozyme (muramidase)